MLKPLADKVLIKPIEVPEKTKGGIYIPDSSKEIPNQGEVIALGNGKMKDGKVYVFTVKKGDKVLYSSYARDEMIKVDGVEYKIMREEEILGIL